MGFVATIPEDRWKLSFEGEDHQLYWTMGREGKGLLTADGDVHTWNTEESRPWHVDYENEHGIDNAVSYFVIDYDGTINDLLGDRLNPGYVQKIQEADPMLRTDGTTWDLDGGWAI